jgi:serine/threonine protein kinase
MGDDSPTKKDGAEPELSPGSSSTVSSTVLSAPPAPPFPMPPAPSAVLAATEVVKTKVSAEPDRRPTTLAPGDLLGGRFRLVRPIGEGGMGAVWAAVNEGFGREVAIKVMLPSIGRDSIAVQRFFNEARICGSIRHPSIVDVLDVGLLPDGAPYLVMELLDGESLDRVLRRVGTLTPTDALAILRDVSRVLALAHARGVVHRDLKPGNLFLHVLPSGEVIVKVLDFGISKVTGGGYPSTVTSLSAIVGSPAYMSPEQARGQLVDARTDVWALGVVLFQCLSARLPYAGHRFPGLLTVISESKPPRLSRITSGLPREVLALCTDAMAHDKDDRIPSATVFAERCEEALQAIGANASAPPPHPNMMAKHAGPPVLPAMPWRTAPFPLIKAAVANVASNVASMATTFSDTLSMTFRSRPSILSQPPRRMPGRFVVLLGALSFAVGTLATVFWRRSIPPSTSSLASAPALSPTPSPAPSPAPPATPTSHASPPPPATETGTATGTASPTASSLVPDAGPDAGPRGTKKTQKPSGIWGYD